MTIKRRNHQRSEYSDPLDASHVNLAPQPIFPSIRVIILLLFIGAIFGFLLYPEISKVVEVVSRYRRSYLESGRSSESAQIDSDARDYQNVNLDSKRRISDNRHDSSVSKNGRDRELYSDDQDEHDIDGDELRSKRSQNENKQSSIVEDDELTKHHQESNFKEANVKPEERDFYDGSDVTEEEYTEMLRDAGEIPKDYKQPHPTEDPTVHKPTVEDLMESEIEELDDTDSGESEETTVETEDFQNQKQQTAKTTKTKQHTEGSSEQQQKTTQDHQQQTSTKKKVEKSEWGGFDNSEWTISGDEKLIKLGGRNKKATINLNTVERKPKTGQNTASKKDLPKQKNSDSKTNSKQEGAKSQHNKIPKTKQTQGSKKGQPSKTSGTDKPPQNKASKTNKKSTNGNTDKSPKDQHVPDKIKNFKYTYLKNISPKKTFIDGRRVPAVELLAMKETNSSVKVHLFDEFLSDAEADGLMKAHDSHVKEASKHEALICFDSINTLRKHLKDAKKTIRVTPNDFIEGTTCVNETFSAKLKKWLHGNWSYSTAFYPGESGFSQILANRIANSMGLKPSHGGKFQLTSYPVGKAYKTHTDCVVDGTDKRDRMASVLIYLNTVEDGGKTEFPDLGIWVKPRKGRALVWNNMDEEGLCEEQSRHESSVVKSGEKYILIRWYYYQNFYSLGKRPDEPKIPIRKLGQPKVSCDEYQNGSCRWYDEWGYDHLVEYRQQKFTLY